MRLRITTAPAPSTPCTCNTDFAISRPIVLTSPMDGSPQCGLLRQNHPMALLMPQSGRRPQHQKRTFRSAIAMSALPPKADICSAMVQVRFGPKADISAQTLRLGFSSNHFDRRDAPTRYVLDHVLHLFRYVPDHQNVKPKRWWASGRGGSSAYLIKKRQCKVTSAARQ